MTYQEVANTCVSSIGAVYFVGPGVLFSKVVLRTVETELDCPARRVPDLNALRFAQQDGAGTVSPAYMVIVHESAAGDLMAALEAGAEMLPRRRLAIAFDRDESARALVAENGDALVERHVSLLPMNANVTNWVRLLQVIQTGGHYLPPEVLHPVADGGAQRPDRPDRPAVRVPTGARAPEALTPREAEVLAMAAAGSPNKAIAGEMELSEHTVKLYMHRIIGKLGVTNRTEAAIWYHRHNDHG
jgi:DNA-binding NarL/FixJ family response regulator